MANAKIGFCLSTFTVSEVVIDQFGLEKLQSIQGRYIWRKTPSGLVPEIVSNLNMQGIPDKDIGIMYDLSPSYVGKKYNGNKRVSGKGLLIWEKSKGMKRMPEILDVKAMLYDEFVKNIRS